jgi:hypothetical protein
MDTRDGSHAKTVGRNHREETFLLVKQEFITLWYRQTHNVLCEAKMMEYGTILYAKSMQRGQ